jgi:peptide deformylase
LGAEYGHGGVIRRFSLALEAVKESIRHRHSSRTRPGRNFRYVSFLPINSCEPPPWRFAGNSGTVVGSFRALSVSLARFLAVLTKGVRMVLEILKFPDPRLRKKGVAITEVTPELKKLAEDMVETMYDENGIGLAAPQVGQSVRLLVIDTRPHDDNDQPTTEGLTELEKAVPQPLVIFNPVITKSQDKTTFEEGCLSVPGFFETVERALYIEATYLDIDGKEQTLKTDGLLAICLQHEMDHLEGKLFIDRLSFLKSNRIKSRIQKHGYPTVEEVEAERADLRERRKEARAKAKAAAESAD